jgi:hypothetical protein
LEVVDVFSDVPHENNSLSFDASGKDAEMNVNPILLASVSRALPNAGNNSIARSPSSSSGPKSPTKFPSVTKSPTPLQLRDHTPPPSRQKQQRQQELQQFDSSSTQYYSLESSTATEKDVSKSSDRKKRLKSSPKPKSSPLPLDLPKKNLTHYFPPLSASTDDLAFLSIPEEESSRQLGAVVPPLSTPVKITAIEPLLPSNLTSSPLPYTSCSLSPLKPTRFQQRQHNEMKQKIETEKKSGEGALTSSNPFSVKSTTASAEITSIESGAKSTAIASEEEMQVENLAKPGTNKRLKSKPLETRSTQSLEKLKPSQFSLSNSAMQSLPTSASSTTSSLPPLNASSKRVRKPVSLSVLANRVSSPKETVTTSKSRPVSQSNSSNSSPETTPVTTPQPASRNKQATQNKQQRVVTTKRSRVQLEENAMIAAPQLVSSDNQTETAPKPKRKRTESYNANRNNTHGAHAANNTPNSNALAFQQQLRNST